MTLLFYLLNILFMFSNFLPFVLASCNRGTTTCSGQNIGTCNINGSFDYKACGTGMSCIVISLGRAFCVNSPVLTNSSITTTTTSATWIQTTIGICNFGLNSCLGSQVGKCGIDGQYTFLDCPIYQSCTNLGGGRAFCISTASPLPTLTILTVITLITPSQPTVTSTFTITNVATTKIMTTIIKSTTTITSSSLPLASINNGPNLISQDQFNSALTMNGYASPSSAVWTSFIGKTSIGNIQSSQELAMLLAHAIFETGGFANLTENGCPCPGRYLSATDIAGEEYYGRGYLQLTWEVNYSAASNDLFGDNRLATDPDQVASDQDIAWMTAFWYWSKFVGIYVNVKNYEFGVSTWAINGDIECNGSSDVSAKERFAIYVIVLQAFGITATPIESGCYN